MRRETGKQPVPRAVFEELTAELDKASDRLKRAYEDGDEVMRGWSDIAAKAQFAASVEPLARRVALLQERLRGVFPVDAPPPEPSDRERTIDEIIRVALSKAEPYRLELWSDGRFIEEIPSDEGPIDPELIAKQLGEQGRDGELRVIAGARGSSHERTMATFPVESS